MTLARALRDHRRAQLARRFRLGKQYEDNNFVFASKIGTPLNFRNLTLRHLASITKSARIDGPVNLYHLRDSFVTLALLAGADVKSVSRAAGHSSVAFILDTFPAMSKDAADRIGALLFGTIPYKDKT